MRRSSVQFRAPAPIKSKSYSIGHFSRKAPSYSFITVPFWLGGAAEVRRRSPLPGRLQPVKQKGLALGQPLDCAWSPAQSTGASKIAHKNTSDSSVSALVDQKDLARFLVTPEVDLNKIHSRRKPRPARTRSIPFHHVGTSNLLAISENRDLLTCHVIDS